MRKLLGKLGGGNCGAIPLRCSAFLADFRGFLSGAMPRSNDPAHIPNHLVCGAKQQLQLSGVARCIHLLSACRGLRD